MAFFEWTWFLQIKVRPTLNGHALSQLQKTNLRWTCLYPVMELWMEMLSADDRWQIWDGLDFCQSSQGSLWMDILLNHGQSLNEHALCQSQKANSQWTCVIRQSEKGYSDCECSLPMKNRLTQHRHALIQVWKAISERTCSQAISKGQFEMDMLPTNRKGPTGYITWKLFVSMLMCYPEWPWNMTQRVEEL